MQNRMLNQVTMETAPHYPKDLATKGYVDRIGWEAVAAVTSAPLPTAPTYDPTEKTLTAGEDGVFPGIDGVAGVAEDLTAQPPVYGTRYLINNQPTKEHNGIYYLFNAGAADAPWVLKRAEDADDAEEFFVGKRVQITSGMNISRQSYKCIQAPFSPFSGPIAFAPDSENGYAAIITGDGATTVFTVGYPMESRNVIVKTYSLGKGTDPDEEVIFGVSVFDGAVELNSGSYVPAADEQFRVVVYLATDVTGGDTPI